MANASRDELIATTVSAIRSHWDRIGKRLLNGRWRPAETLYNCFEADTVLRRKSLAHRFYSAEHVERVLSFSDASLIKNISFFVEAAVIQVWNEFEDESAKQRSYMRSLIKSEYVLVEDPDCESASAAAYPARVVYDDWYERSVGADSAYEGYIMKSTGEAFTKREYEWMEASVEGEAEKSGEEGWLSETIHESPNRIFVRIFPIC